MAKRNFDLSSVARLEIAQPWKKVTSKEGDVAQENLGRDDLSARDKSICLRSGGEGRICALNGVPA